MRPVPLGLPVETQMFGFQVLKAVVAAGALALMAGASAAATVINVDDTYPGISPLNGVLTCAQTCAGLVATGPSVWAIDGAKLFLVHPPNIANETAFVNTATGSSFLTGTKTDVSGDPFSFVTNALYILFKIGGGGQEASTFLIHNTYGAGLQITWDAVDGQGAGLSHYTTFGVAPPAAVVPVPAAGFLLIGALGGLAALRRRRHV